MASIIRKEDIEGIEQVTAHNLEIYVVLIKQDGRYYIDEPRRPIMGEMDIITVTEDISFKYIKEKPDYFGLVSGVITGGKDLKKGIAFCNRLTKLGIDSRKIALAKCYVQPHTRYWKSIPQSREISAKSITIDKIYDYKDLKYYGKKDNEKV